MEPSSAITLVCDTREQLPYSDLFKTPNIRGTLDIGDYSICGLEHLIAIERKSLQDLLGSLTNGRDRFEAELKRARSLHKFFVVVECQVSDLLVQDFGRLSRANPKSIWGTINFWSVRYCPFLFTGSRETSARVCESLLVAYARDVFKSADAMLGAQRRLQKTG